MAFPVLGIQRVLKPTAVMCAKCFIRHEKARINYAFHPGSAGISVCHQKVVFICKGLQRKGKTWVL